MNSGTKAIWQYPKISRRAFLAGLMASSTFPSIDAYGESTNEDVVEVVRGPYLQRSHPGGIVIMWYTDTPTVTNVRYGTSIHSLDQSFVVEGQRRRHVARINGLESSTKYYYRVDPVNSNEIGDEDTYFYTAPPQGAPAPIRVWALGDSGNVNEESLEMRDSYYGYSNRHTDVCLMLGDNAYPNGTDSEYHEAVFKMFARQLRKTPLWPAYGNHEALCEDCVSANQLGPFFSLFKTPMLGEAGGMSSLRRDFYSFDYGNVHFVCLNSHDGSDSHMLNWLREDLEQCHSTWLIAYWHHPPYTKGFHDSDSSPQLVYMRNHVLPMLESFGVDLVLTGHNHAYERSYFMHGHYGTSGTLRSEMIIDNGDGSANSDGAYTKEVGRRPGAVYVAAGCASEIKRGTLDHSAMAVSLSTIGSLVIDIYGDILDVRFLGQHGEIHDSFQIEKTRATYLPIHLDGNTA